MGVAAREDGRTGSFLIAVSANGPMISGKTATAGGQRARFQP